MNKREVYNANFLIGNLNHRVTRVAYSKADVMASVKREFPEAALIRVESV